MQHEALSQERVYFCLSGCRTEMSARKINPFKHRDVLWRMRAKAATGVRSPGWEMAAATAVPPATRRPVPKKVPIIRLPHDRLLKSFERKFPEAVEESYMRTVDGTVVSKSVVFVQKQYEFIRKGHSEEEAFSLAEKAIKDEEQKAYDEIQEMTREARSKGAVPALSALDSKDDRWERFQFWRTQMEEKPYMIWPKEKRASLDHWIARKILGWEPHQTRYLGKEKFQKGIAAVRDIIFKDVAPWSRADSALSEKELQELKYEKAAAEYQELESRMLRVRPSTWSEKELSGMKEWLDKNYEYVLVGVKDEEGGALVEGGLVDKERKAARLNVLQYIAFPLLRPEFQAIPSLSRFLSEAMLETAKLEAYGLRPILQGPLGKAKPDYIAAETNLNDSFPKFVVKAYVVLAVEHPFTWRLLHYVLTNLAEKSKPEDLANLPELRGLSSSKEVSAFIAERWRDLSEALHTIAYGDDVTSLSKDIASAYRGINELHRIAEELLHLHGPGHPIDSEVQAFLDQHHGWAEKDTAVSEALRKYDETVGALFAFDRPALEKAAVAKEQRQSDILETARLDFTWTAREAARKTYEKEAGLKDVDAYDEKWLSRDPKSPLEGATINEEDVRDYEAECGPWLRPEAVEEDEKKGSTGK